jgi:hypothetical protein
MRCLVLRVGVAELLSPDRERGFVEKIVDHVIANPALQRELPHKSQVVAINAQHVSAVCLQTVAPGRTRPF